MANQNDKYLKIESLGLKYIKGYEGLYAVDTSGQIIKLRVIKPTLDVHKQLIVKLADKDGKRKEQRVHKLVADAFLRPLRDGEVVYHKNGIKTDNFINNLGIIQLTELGKRTGAQSRRRPVVKIDGTGDVVEFYTSAREAAKQNYMSRQTITDRCNGKVKGEFACDGYKYVWDEGVED